MAVEEHNLEVGGSSVRYPTAGEGPPLVLLHGVGTSALEWNRAIPALARGRSVYAPDLLGPESGDGEVHSSVSIVSSVAEFLDALGTSGPWVGNSLGSLVALRLALSNTSWVKAPRPDGQRGARAGGRPGPGLGDAPGLRRGGNLLGQNTNGRRGPGGGRRFSSASPLRRPLGGWRRSTGLV
jgi:pimeloyl-ACP methyl ester carboxylesterase